MGWFNILMAVRELGKKGEFTSRDLATQLGIAKKEDGVSVAAGWLSKFFRWGYVNKVGATKGKYRWERKFEVTRWGKKKSEPGKKRKSMREKIIKEFLEEQAQERKTREEKKS